jgi:enterochelin esterase family protein
MDEEFVQSNVKPPGRRIWSVSPRLETPSALLVFLDAELYLERVLAVDAVRQLEERKLVPPVASVFVSSNGPAARHADYVCDEAYARFLVEDLLPFVTQRRPTAVFERVVLIGLSLSGLAAAHATLTTGSFRAAICQSPSLWWERERFASAVPDAGSEPAAFWISVGDGETVTGVSHPPSGLSQDTSQLDACNRGADALRAAGYPVALRVFHGGHDPVCWRDDLARALPWATSA